MDRRIKFRHLDAFSAIARAQSFKNAADQLGLTQPAISKTLKELEDILGTDLMRRSRAGVELTSEGEIFLQFAEQSSAALQHGLRSLRSAGQGGTILRVGALPSVASRLMPKAALEFASASPNVQLEVHEGPHHDLVARLRSGRLDLVAGRLGRPETMTALTFQQLYAEDVVVVANPNSPAASVRSFDALSQFRVLYPPKDSAIRPVVARMLISKGVPLFPNRIETTSPAFCKTVVQADPNAVWVISRGVVQEEIATGDLIGTHPPPPARSASWSARKRFNPLRPENSCAP